jgi:hypothetical protein
VTASHGARWIAAVVGVLAAFILAMLLLSSLGLRTEARDVDGMSEAQMWLGLFVFGALVGGWHASEEGRRQAFWENNTADFRRQGKAPDAELEALSGARAAFHARYRSALGVAVAVPVFGLVLFVWSGMPWVRAVASSLVLALALGFSCIVAFDRAHVRYLPAPR